MRLQKFFQSRKSQSPSQSPSLDSSSLSSHESSMSSSSSTRSQPERSLESGKNNSHNRKMFPLFSRKASSLSKQASDSSLLVNTSFKTEGSSFKSEIQQQPDFVPSSAELAEAFRYFDANGDGKISATELGSVLRSLGDNPSDKELERMVEEVDADGDGFIDLQEFINLNTMALGSTEGVDGENTCEDVMKAAFHMFDIDRNGFISADELHRVMLGLGDKSLTMEECRCMIKSFDKDGDGFVNFEEFQWMMSGNCVC